MKPDADANSNSGRCANSDCPAHTDHTLGGNYHRIVAKSGLCYNCDRAKRRAGVDITYAMIVAPENANKASVIEAKRVVAEARKMWRNKMRRRKNPYEVLRKDCIRATGAALATGDRAPRYGRFTLNDKEIGMHDAVWMLWNKCDIPPDTYGITHDCGDRECSNPFHLRRGSPTSNARDTRDHGRCPWAKLDREKVDDIKPRLREESVSAIAFECGVSPSAIYSIKRGATWRDASEGYVDE